MIAGGDCCITQQNAPLGVSLRSTHAACRPHNHKLPCDIFMNFLSKSSVIMAACFLIFSRALASDMTAANIQVRFTPKNMAIWVLDSQEKDISYLDAKSKPKNMTKFMNSIVLSFDGDFNIKIKNTVIKSSHGNVDINNIPMNKNINAVIDGNGNINFGAFIRSFD